MNVVYAECHSCEVNLRIGRISIVLTSDPIICVCLTCSSLEEKQHAYQEWCLAAVRGAVP